MHRDVRVPEGTVGTSMSWASLMVLFGGKVSFVSSHCSIPWWWYRTTAAQKLAVQDLGRFPISGGKLRPILQPLTLAANNLEKGGLNGTWCGLPNSWLLQLACKCQQECLVALLCKVSVSRNMWKVFLGLSLLFSACASGSLKEDSAWWPVWFPQWHH